MKRKRIYQGLVLVSLATFCGLLIRGRSPEFSPPITQIITEESENAASLPQEKWKSITQRLTDPDLLAEKAKKAEKIRLAKWKAEFPWKPTHDSYLKFDPNRHIEGAGNGRSSNTDIATRQHHSYLKYFFADEDRFLPQFEKFSKILAEHQRGENPFMVGNSFWMFRQYYHAAYEHEPDEYVLENGAKVKNGLFSYLTWGDRAKSAHESLRGYLRNWKWLNPEFKTNQGKANANALIERLVAEVEGMGDLSLNVLGGDGMLHGNHPDIQALLAGEEELLVPYAGWNEKSERYWGEQTRKFNKSLAEGDPSLKAIAPELFPPVGVKNGQLVDKDGAPVRWSEGTDIVLVNERGERVPTIVEANGTISLPTPEEVTVMRENGQVQNAEFKNLPPEMAEAILKAKQEAGK